MRPAIRIVPSSYRRIQYATCKLLSTQPPVPRPYKPASPDERLSRRRLDQEAELKPKEAEKSKWSWLWPFQRRKMPLEQKPEEPPDMARAFAASKRYVEEGVVDEKYREAGKHVTRLIWALPIVIGVGVILFQRRFQGAEQKRFPKVKKQQELR